MEISLISSIFGTLGISVVGLVVWSIQRHVSSTSLNTIQLAVLTDKVQSLTTKIDSFQVYLFKVDRLEQDLHHAHEKIRDLKSIRSLT